MIFKKLLITTICFFMFVPTIVMANSVPYSKDSTILSSLYFMCSKHPTKHFVAYYFPSPSQPINNNYKNYKSWKDYDYLIVQPNGEVKEDNKLKLLKTNNGSTYGDDASLTCYTKNNKIYWYTGKPAYYVKNNVLYNGWNNSFIASLRKVGPLTLFYDKKDRWLGLRADLSQENILTYLAFYYNSIDNYGNKIPFTIKLKGINSNSNYIIDSHNKHVTFYYINDNDKLESPEIILGYKNKHSFYDVKKQLIGTYHPLTGLITNYENIVIGKITKDSYVYGKTNNLLGRIGKFKYWGTIDNYVIKTAKIYNATDKYIANIFNINILKKN